MEENKALIKKFYQVFYNDKDVVKARAMMAPDLINHHPFNGKGADSTIQGIQQYVFTPYPQFKIFIKRMIAEGNYVWVQSFTQNSPDDKGTMSMDIWRIEGGKIAEHWDVVQPVPDGVTAESMYN